MPPKNSSKKRKSSHKKVTKQQVVPNEGENCKEIFESKAEAPKACIEKNSGDKDEGPLLNMGTAKPDTNNVDIVEIREEPGSMESSERDKLHSDAEVRLERAVNAKDEMFG